MQITSASGAWQYLISARETQTQEGPLPNGLAPGQPMQGFKVFVSQPYIFSCCGNREGGILYYHLHFCDSEWLQPGPLKHLPVWMHFRCTGGCEPVYLCVFVSLHSGCLLEQAALPLAYVSVATCLTAWESFPWLFGAIPRQLQQQKAHSAAGNY